MAYFLLDCTAVMGEAARGDMIVREHRMHVIRYIPSYLYDTKQPRVPTPDVVYFCGECGVRIIQRPELWRLPGRVALCPNCFSLNEA